ncbi:MAG: bacteriohemerythrin [Candidatus Thiodiazotropha taylori]|uniref:Bacteriohemerythrin n=1 Tax=Candidatus Thiodiazotropha taylori TaxID=2792791 RepID=A0A9E4P6K0_9GAMM|nr:bacteriohemerythrin [Candidatus Thiodiazotropha taylori]MCG7964684.1 bacteriohemerythrin [Candidatus Thiodiazotropha endolucinida]MCG7967457.1 bacteriohemerythrin [Candidatus Thiodiazotropha taylori]MCG8027262.1 bacteriohemerythrin [Candidatus Thiodiazotropha taylori]MCG8039959.1 bacteriohemerythrin [Candidatus Thiodiazotropha taylori]
MTKKSSIRWCQEMATGVDVIDSQHQNLLQMVNDAYQELDKEVSEIVFQRVTKELLSYAIYHFQTEEHLMKEYGYFEECPEEAALHVDEHRSFSAKVVAARDSVNSEVKEEMEQILEFLNNWILNHTQNVDLKLGGFISLKEKQRGTEANG